ncbi:hypothetical protein [uncultured Roseibium sp.]|nr:hypothetical protein [uncultured Roseibium sp.]
MTEDGWHGGTTSIATNVPLYLFSNALAPEEEQVHSQLGIAASILALTGIAPSNGMGDALLIP